MAGSLPGPIPDSTRKEGTHLRGRGRSLSPEVTESGSLSYRSRPPRPPRSPLLRLCRTTCPSAGPAAPGHAPAARPQPIPGVPCSFRGSPLVARARPMGRGARGAQAPPPAPGPAVHQGHGHGRRSENKPERSARVGTAVQGNRLHCTTSPSLSQTGPP